MNIEYNRKQMKKRSKGRLKKHYFVFLIICTIIALFGISNSEDLEAIYLTQDKGVNASKGADIDTSNSIFEAIDKISESNKGVPEDFVQEALKDIEDIKIGPIEIGRSKGAFAQIINSFTSGETFLQGYVIARSITHSDSASLVIMILLSVVIMLLFTIFIVGALEVIFARVFLEGRTYDKFSSSTVLFLIRRRKWTCASKNMFFASFLQFLWSLTIIGGIIKKYSYFMVPYIIAERPDLGARETVTLSRQMMNGHKWECFVFNLSFIGWSLLKIVTFGLSGLLFSTPYREAAKAEYVEYIRRDAKNKNIPNVNKLSDVYLFQLASKQELKSAYSDIEELKKQQSEENIEKERGIKGFFANVFGIIPKYDEKEKKYNEIKERQVTIENFQNAINGLAYPTRLSPVPERDKKNRISLFHVMRRYSILSLVMLFFLTSIIGWTWEVILHLIEDGEFVNRGVCFGPWLPIYGFGAIAILTILYKFRKNPVLEFTTAILLCGTMEYITSIILEKVHDGTRWWDYTGYFLNIDGRVCAEGLLIFGIAGVVVVYLLAPIFDDFINKFSRKIIVPIAVILILLFAIDKAYSIVHPNVGKGITKDGNTSYGATLSSNQLLAINQNVHIAEIDQRRIK